MSSSKKFLAPVLQKLRQDMVDAITGLTYVGDTKVTSFAGAAGLPAYVKVGKKVVDIPDSAAQIATFDEATATLGPDRHRGVLARNACHFAPFSWQRWANYHNEARREATAHHAKTGGKLGAPGKLEHHEQLARVNNYYANHFLQDSFAAGHLINKTLVMQWFLEYASKWAGMPKLNAAKAMTTKAQPGIAGRHLYGGPDTRTSASQDSNSGTIAADPQTTRERTDGGRKLSGSGLNAGAHGRAFAYAQYNAFLNSSYISLAANAAHDHFNDIGLTVVNGRGDRYTIGGDGTLLDLNDAAAMTNVLEANVNADQAIEELLTLTVGKTSVDLDSIFARFPRAVVVKGVSAPVPLESWNDGVLREICFKTIFPKEMESFLVLRAQFPELVEGTGPVPLSSD
ncbi:hypothetical protein [Fodinicola feengrottensis]|uniref:hypothetical protein n=1 Tax=Fodinicola feengrottensis TaxID=435914 RepID=UPI0013D6F39D|nr:hypothetical protein [Fodinicola feengrottensis]